MSDSEYKPVSIGNWIITFIVLAIPLLNLIMLIVWAVGESTHPSKKNYARANLVLFGIAICIGILAAIILPILGNHKSGPGV